MMELHVTLTDEQIEQIAHRAAQILTEREEERTPWLHVDAAAGYLRCPKSRLYALVSAHRIPHHRDGSRLLFDRSELDTWVRNGGGKRT